MGTKKVAVLGSGKIGKLVAYLLGSTDDYRVRLADVSLKTAEAALKLGTGGTLKNAEAAVADFTSEADLKKVLKGEDYVLSCAPFHCNTLIARVAKELGVHYFDLTEDVATTKAVKDFSVGAKTAFMPQCGLAPGFITIAANHLTKKFDSLDSIKMRVGALPIYPHNRLKYNLTWSTEGLVNEYGNPCEAISDGKLCLVPPLEGLETLSIDGCEYEAFNTSGGLGTLAETMAGKVRALDYKSMRYPGHRDIIALLMNDLRLTEDREALCKIFDRALPYTVQDVVVVFVTVTGTKGGKYHQESYVKKIYNETIGGQHWGAIQITTAGGICAVLDLHAQGQIKQEGFIRQEDVPFEAFIQNRYGKYYA